MKIAVLNYCTGNITIEDVPEHLKNREIEIICDKLGIDLGNTECMLINDALTIDIDTKECKANITIN